MLDDRMYLYIVGRAVEALNRYRFPVSNRSVRIVLRPILYRLMVGRLRELPEKYSRYVINCLINWEPSAKQRKLLSLTLVNSSSYAVYEEEE